MIPETLRSLSFASLRHNVFATLCLCVFATPINAQETLVHPKIGTSVQDANKDVTITLIGKKQNYAWNDKETHDEDILSPKSVHIHPNGKKYYVNSLEGGTTVAYDFETNTKIKAIHHKFDESHASLWSKPSGLFPWTHYKENNTFMGKPVESTFSHNGKYLWVPYYRRSFDINAQDPSALSVIDTQNDTIIRLMETGPLPKMITTSPDGNYIAVSHWGNNTVGVIDISSSKPEDWHYVSVLVVDYQLKLNYPLDHSVDRDSGSGYALRGTVFTPDNKYLLVGCMGGGGGIAVIDIPNRQYLGRVHGMLANTRHILLKNDYLYLSANKSGHVQRIKLDKFIESFKDFKNKITHVNGWETAKVGSGARTISASPDGRYIFAACNNESMLYVVDTETMKAICKIAVDSFPVGLDVSSDGQYVFVTSQGHKHGGGNAVNIYKVEYKYPMKGLQTTDNGLQTTDNGLVDSLTCGPVDSEASSPDSNLLYYIIGGAVVLLMLIVKLLIRSKKKKKHERMRSLASCLAVGMLMLFASCETKAQAPVVNADSTEVKEEKPQTLTLLFAGDLMSHKPQITAALKNGKYDFEEVFRFVKPIVSEPDIAIANFETTLAGAPYSGYPCFCVPDEYLYAVKDAGFDVLLTANNHSVDRGAKGIKMTIEKMDSLKIPHLGTYVNQEDRDKKYPYLLEKNGFKLALLVYTYDTNGIPVPKPNIVNLIDRKQIEQDIEKAKAMQPDAIIAFMHWGIEYALRENAEQRSLTQFLLDKGVTHVIGGHPHVVEPLEVRTDSLGDKHLVVYSLGNYVSNQSKPNTDGGLMVNMTLTKENGKTRMTDCSYQMHWVSRPPISGHKNYRVYPVNDTTITLNAQEKRLMNIFTTNARDLFKKYNKDINEK